MKISSYITLKNPVQMDYPFEAAIRSLYAFSDEIVVCNTSDGSDATETILEALAKEFEALPGLTPKVFKVVVPTFIDWLAPNHGIYDGITKAFARENCSGDYCFQIDADEVVMSTREQIENCCNKLDEDYPLLALPVVEYWGSDGKVRVDVNPWKWRLSKNSKNITHGIPGALRKTVNGLLYAQHGTDGCDYIFKDNQKVVPCIQFVKPEVEEIRKRAVFDGNYVGIYEAWFNQVVTKLPTIYHFSWWSVYAKMNKYKHFWNDSWISLYNEKRSDGYNPFFSKPFSMVDVQEMKTVAAALEKNCGGYIFHNPADLNSLPKTNHVIIKQEIPDLVKNWCVKHEKDKQS
jgi:hypothetical protein